MVKNKFEELGLSQASIEVVERKGFVNSTEIQKRIIPLIFKNKKDIIGISKTGSGKTASFGLPILDLIKNEKDFIEVLILTPTRELAQQLTKELIIFKNNRKTKIVTIYGGASINKQINEIKNGTNIIIGTPGRVLDLIKRKVLNFSKIKYFILDEADEMLKMGFLEDIEFLFKIMPKERRVLLFSATMPIKIKELTKKYISNREIVEIKTNNLNKPNIKQKYLILKKEEKFSALCRLIDFDEGFYGIVFCMTKKNVDDLTAKLKDRRYDVDSIHGDIKQNIRTSILRNFQEKIIKILVATDVAARGIDIENLTYVVNYSLPKELDTYTHRIGRTGRAGKSGVAISFITNKERFFLNKLENKTQSKIELGTLPKKSIILEIKNKKFENYLIESIKKNGSNKDQGKNEIRQNLLNTFTSDEIINSLLFELDKENTERIEENFTTSETVKLFIAMGKNKGFNPRKLFQFLERETHTKIDGNNVKINNKFSLIDVPKLQAEVILKKFEEIRRDGIPLVELASN